MPDTLPTLQLTKMFNYVKKLVTLETFLAQIATLLNMQNPQAFSRDA